MSRDWSWWQAWKSGDDDAFSRSLAKETDRSLAKDPGRWSWGKSTDEVIADHPRITGHRGGHVADRRHRTGKGHVEGGHSGERGRWSDAEWRNAHDDYERQNPPDRRDPPPGYRSW